MHLDLLMWITIHILKAGLDILGPLFQWAQGNPGHMSYRSDGLRVSPHADSKRRKWLPDTLELNYYVITFDYSLK